MIWKDERKGEEGESAEMKRSMLDSMHYLYSQSIIKYIIGRVGSDYTAVPCNRRRLRGIVLLQ